MIVILNVNVQLTTQQTILTGENTHYRSQKNYKFVSSERHHCILISKLVSFARWQHKTLTRTYRGEQTRIL